MAALYPKPQSIRTRIAQGKDILHGADKRTRWYRRLQELIDIHVREMGGGDSITQAQFVLIRSAATMTVALEKLEVGFANEQELNVKKLSEYVTYVNALRRVFSELGMTGNPHVPLRQAQNGAPGYDVSTLTPEEREQFTILMHRVTNFGLNTLPRSDLALLLPMLRRVFRKDGLGTSSERPMDEIAPYTGDRT